MSEFRAIYEFKTKDLGAHVKLHSTKAVFTTGHPASFQDSLSEGDLQFTLCCQGSQTTQQSFLTGAKQRASEPQRAFLRHRPSAWTLSVLVCGGTAGNHGVWGLPAVDMNVAGSAQPCAPRTVWATWCFETFRDKVISKLLELLNPRNPFTYLKW